MLTPLCVLTVQTVYNLETITICLPLRRDKASSFYSTYHLPLMGMGLQERGAGTHDFPSLAPRVARCTDRLQTSLWRGKIRTLRQSTLSCGLSGAIQIEDHPSLSLAIP